MSLLERIYFFHLKVQSGQFPNTTSLTREFEISPATAYRDLAYLRDRLLAPLAFNQQKNGFFYTRRDFQLPFEDSPAITLILGLLGNIAEEAGLTDLKELQEIKQRLQGVLFPGKKEIRDLLHCEWVEKEYIKAKVFKSVLTALRDQRQLRLNYRDGTGKMSQRTVDPLKLVNYQGRWYLLAWCRKRQGRRMFHLARMLEAGQTEDAIEHTLEENDNWLTGSFGIFKGPVTELVTIRFTGTAAEIIQYQSWHPDQQIMQEKDGIQLTLPVADHRELIMKVLQFGAQAEIVAPETLRTKLQNEIHQMSRLYCK